MSGMSINNEKSSQWLCPIHIVVFTLLSLAPSPLALLFTISLLFHHFSSASVATTGLSLLSFSWITFFSLYFGYLFKFSPNYLVCYFCDELVKKNTTLSTEVNLSQREKKKRIIQKPWYYSNIENVTSFSCLKRLVFELGKHKQIRQHHFNRSQHCLCRCVWIWFRSYRDWKFRAYSIICNGNWMLKSLFVHCILYSWWLSKNRFIKRLWIQ